MTRIAVVAIVALTAALTASLAACGTPAEERSLSELTQLAISVTADTGVPDVFDSPLRGSLDVALADPQFDCFQLAGSAHLELDGEREDYRQLGGPYMDENHGAVESGCSTPSFIMNAVPDDAITSSELVLHDDTAEYTLTVGALGKNPHVSLSGTLRRGQPAVLVVDDPRAVVYASVYWTNMDGYPWMVTPDFSTPGELHFTVPTNAATGAGELAVELHVRPTDVGCDGFATCDVTILGGASFPASVTQ